MKRSLTALAVCSAFLVIAGEAAADTWNAGTLSTTASVNTFTHSPPTTTFTDLINFTIPQLSDLGASAIPLNLTFPGVQYAVFNLMGYLYGGHGASGTALDSMQGNNTTYTFANLGAGDYSFKFTGDLGTSGGGYMVGLSIAPVPEPSEWAMMLAGLGIVGAVAARRRRRA